MNRLKIVLIGKLWGVGGAEKSLVMLANSLAERNHDVTLLAMEKGDIFYPVHEDVNIKYIADQGSIGIIRRMHRLKQIIKVLKEIKPDIAICFGMLVGVIGPKLLGIKTIYSERGNPGTKSNKSIIGLVRSLIFPWLDGFVFQLEGAKNFFSKKVQNKSTVIPNPVYMKYDDYDIPEKREKVIVNVGRLHSQKNQRLLISAFNEVVDEFPDYKLHIYGQDGGLESELKKYVKDLNLERKVLFLGTTDKLWDEIVTASMFVLSSDYEGMPNALMEAMALGIPSVSTDCPPGGPAALITHKKNGLLCPVGDVEALTECMRLVLSSKQNSEKMGLEAKKICYTHTVQEIMNKWNNYLIKVTDAI